MMDAHRRFPAQAMIGKAIAYSMVALAWMGAGWPSPLAAQGVAPAATLDEPATTPVSTQTGADPTRVSRSQLEQFIEQLGDPLFIERERAMKQLLEVGNQATPLLRAATRHSDREIRVRSRWLLAEIDRMNRQRRIAEFLAGAPASQATDLPGWQRLRSLLGDSPAVRQVMAEMLEEEWDLLIETDPAAGSENGVQNEPAVANNVSSEAFNARVMELFQQTRTQQMTAPDASVAALMLAGIGTAIHVTPESHSYIASMCYRLKVPTSQPGETSAAGDLAPRMQTREDVLRGLMAAWICKEVGDHGTQLNLNLALRFDLPDGLTLAERMIEDESLAVDRKILGMLALVRFGDQRHKPLLVPFLDDETVIYQEKDPKSKENGFQMQVRDVALAGLMKLDDMDPQKLGFDRLRTNPYTVFITNTIGFTDDQKRAQALAAWKEHQDTKTDQNATDQDATDRGAKTDQDATSKADGDAPADRQ